MCVSGEDFVEDRAVVLTLNILVILQGDDILEAEWLSRDRMFVKLADVRKDIAQVIYCPIRCACLQQKHPPDEQLTVCRVLTKDLQYQRLHVCPICVQMVR